MRPNQTLGFTSLHELVVRTVEEGDEDGLARLATQFGWSEKVLRVLPLKISQLNKVVSNLEDKIAREHGKNVVSRTDPEDED